MDTEHGGRRPTSAPDARSGQPDTVGTVLWFTGLSGAGKSTTARAVAEALTARGVRCTLLDGDDIRQRLCPDLGFCRSDRDTQVLRVAALAKALTDRGEVVLCALISPYRSTRQRAREIVGLERFVEIFVDTPLSVCEARDVKGLYARARRGTLTSLTGVDDPYEPPQSPEVAIATTDCAVMTNVERILALLAARSPWSPSFVSIASSGT